MHVLDLSWSKRAMDIEDIPVCQHAPSLICRDDGIIRRKLAMDRPAALAQLEPDRSKFAAPELSGSPGLTGR